MMARESSSPAGGCGLGGADGREEYGLAGGSAGADAVSAVDDLLPRCDDARGDTDEMAGDEPGGAGMVAEVGKCKAESGKQKAEMKCERAVLPDAAGFYWWRKCPDQEWRMVQIVDFAAGYPSEPPKLAAYDVEYRAWGGRTLRMWEIHDPIGEWVECHKPNAEVSHGDSEKRS